MQQRRWRAGAKQTDTEIRLHVRNRHNHKLFIYSKGNKPGEKKCLGERMRGRKRVEEENGVRVGKNINVDHINGPDRVNCKWIFAHATRHRPAAHFVLFSGWKQTTTILVRRHVRCSVCARHWTTPLKSSIFERQLFMAAVWCSLVLNAQWASNLRTIYYRKNESNEQFEQMIFFFAPNRR